LLRRQAGVTLYVVLLAAFKTLLARYSGRTDIIVGSDVAVREPSQVEDLIGIFVNQIVLRTDLRGAPSFLELLVRVRDVVLQGMANRSVPLQLVAEHLHVSRDRSRSPLFQILFDLQQYQLPVQEGVEFKIRRLDFNWLTAKYDISLFMEEESGDIRATLEYNADLFDEPTVQRFLAHYVLVLDSAVRDPKQPVNELTVLDAPAQRKLAADFNESFELV
jgi:non-ribosomal peptide synthetase component F